MHTTRTIATSLLLVASTVGFAVTGGASALTGAPPAAARDSGAALISMRTEDFAFSPNGDQRQDKARVTFRLAKSAKVTVEITRGRGANERVIVRPDRLGRLSAGPHTWTWDGRKSNGSRAGDGGFNLVVKAKRPQGKAHFAFVRVRVDTAYVAGQVIVSDDVVYPRTTRVRDRIRFAYGGADVDVVLGHASVRSASGEPVARWRLDLRHTSRVFDGRDEAGRPLPPGTYWIRLVGSDAAGNRGRSDRYPITVSDVPLVEVAGTTTVTPAESGSLSPYGSIDNRCGAVDPSARYRGGFTYRAIALEDCPYAQDGSSPSSASSYARAEHSIAPGLVSPRGILTARVAMTGQPTGSGETDVATLEAYRSRVVTEQAAGESVTATAVVERPFRPVGCGTSPCSTMAWSVLAAGGNSYDVASFTVDYTYLTPAS